MYPWGDRSHVRRVLDVNQVSSSTSFAFEACEISEPFLERYDAQRLLVNVVEGILKKNADQLKTAMQAVTGEEGVSLTDLVIELRSAASGFQSLGELFECAAARIEVVEASSI